MEPVRVLFAGGGTGGHLFPGIAIADEIQRMVPDASIMFLGTKKKIEARVIPQKGYRFETIWISGFHRSLRLSNLLFPLKVIVAFMQARSIIRKFHPDVVVGTGGYVSGPVLRAATMMGIPTVIQEQNSYPGVTTRMLAGRVREVHLTFESSRKFLHRTDNIFITGNPTRRDLALVGKDEALRYFCFDPASRARTLLVVGGSLGAHTINEAVRRSFDALIGNGWRIVWQTGESDYPAAKQVAAKFPAAMAWVNAFIERMDYAYAAADLVVCRAGATTLAELALLGKPSVLVPYPFAAADHQTENARTVADAGAAILMEDRVVSERLLSVLQELEDAHVLSAMSERAKMLGKPDAARTIAERVVRLAGKPLTQHDGSASDARRQAPHG